MKSTHYKAAIVGCGRIASMFAQDKRRRGVVTHAQAYQRHPRTVLVAACDLDAQRLSAFGEQWKVKSLYTDFETMLRKERPDLLSVCTWNTTHLALVEIAARMGVKGILCEKPLADSMESASHMVRICRDRKIPLLVNYSRRYNALHQKIKQMIDRGELGEIQSVSAYYVAGVANTGTHLFDLLDFFFGPVAWVSAHPDKILGDKDPSVDAYLFFKKGFGAALTALDVRHYMQFEIDIYGSKGRLRLSDTGLRAERWKVVPHSVFSEYKTLGASKGLSTDFSKNLLNAVDNLIQVCEGQVAPLCSGEEALKSLEVALALYESLRKKTRVDIPFKNKKLTLESK